MKPTADRSPKTRSARLLAVMAWLRDRQHGCPWDIEQTFRRSRRTPSRKPTRSPTRSSATTCRRSRRSSATCCCRSSTTPRWRARPARFDFDDVAAAIADKMVDRHPHVFGDARDRRRRAQTISWEARKAAERAKNAAREPAGALDGVARALPALLRAEKTPEARRPGRLRLDGHRRRSSTRSRRNWASSGPSSRPARPTRARRRRTGRRAVRRREPRPPSARSTRKPRCARPTTSSSALPPSRAAASPRKGENPRRPRSRRWKPSGRTPRRELRDDAPLSARHSPAAAAGPSRTTPGLRHDFGRCGRR